MKTLSEILFKSYQLLISPFLHQAALWPGGCRFFPTCSEYGLKAIRQYGLTSGFMLFLKRLSRCHSYSVAGYDPVRNLHRLPKPLHKKRLRHKDKVAEKAPSAFSAKYLAGKFLTGYDPVPKP